MRIAFSSPGDFGLGYNSLVRGEGKYVQTLAYALAKNPKNEIVILGQNNKTYQDGNVLYFSVYNDFNTEFDLFFSMGDSFIDSGLETNWMTEHVSKIKTKKRIFMSFFGSDNHQKCIYPVVYPYYYREVDNIKTFCLPICLGSENDLNKNNFNEKNAIWTTKNAHENAQYLWLSLNKCLNYVISKGGKLIAIDGHCLLEKEYENSDAVKNLINCNKSSFWYQKQWLPYNKMEYVMSKSKFITGIHHPIVGPSQLQIVFNGGVPVIFENQKELPPYNNTKMPYIEFNNVKESIDRCYSSLDDEFEYNLWLENCKETIRNTYTTEVFFKEWDKFLQTIGI